LARPSAACADAAGTSTTSRRENKAIRAVVLLIGLLAFRALSK
jgi:hypothetical protein